MKRIEDGLERLLFASRWLAAPIYIGLVFCLAMLLVVFARYLVWIGSQIFTLSVHQTAVAVLAFIDLALIANLVLIVIYVGYETFVSRIDIEHDDRPTWIGEVGYSGLKTKLLSSLVAITAIDLLKAFMEIQSEEGHPPAELRWLVGIHLTLLATLVLSSLGNWLNGETGARR
ncbi:MAG TPA: YqhA family protein [Allosphingosinicella sp.]|nr:YqhA family protein [Allosphingosinicella sp.]